VRVVLSSYYSLNRIPIELSTAFRIQYVNSAVSQTPDCTSDQCCDITILFLNAQTS